MKKCIVEGLDPIIFNFMGLFRGKNIEMQFTLFKTIDRAISPKIIHYLCKNISLL